MREGERYVKHLGCKECDGRGWFYKNAFLDFGLGNPENKVQCEACLDAYQKHVAAGGADARRAAR